MIKGIGIDIVETARFMDLHRNAEYLHQILTEEEIRQAGLSEQPANFIAKTFAVKEAVVKALGCGLNAGWFWHEIELTGAEGIRLSGFYRSAAQERSVEEIHYTHSSTMRYTVALVVLEG